MVPKKLLKELYRFSMDLIVKMLIIKQELIGTEKTIMQHNPNEKLQMGDGRELHAQDLLLGYAILVPSRYNTQPWKFAADDNEDEVICGQGAVA
jgi:hypothetical protein